MEDFGEEFESMMGSGAEQLSLLPIPNIPFRAKVASSTSLSDAEVIESSFTSFFSLFSKYIA